MNDHERFRSEFDACLDGTLGAAESAALARHLASCAECASEFAGLRSLLAAAQELPRELPPAPQIFGRVLTAIGRGEADAITDGDDRHVARGGEADAVAGGEEWDVAAVPGAGMAAGSGFATRADTPRRRPLPVRASSWGGGRSVRMRWAIGATALVAAALIGIVFAPGRPTGFRPAYDPDGGTGESAAQASDASAGADGSLQDAYDQEGSVAPLFVTTLVCALELECAGAGRELQARAGAAGAGGEAFVAAALAHDVQVLDEAIAETRVALATSPADPGLLHLLTLRYEQKLNVLHQALRLSAEA